MGWRRCEFHAGKSARTTAKCKKSRRKAVGARDIPPKVDVAGLHQPSDWWPSTGGSSAVLPRPVTLGRRRRISLSSAYAPQNACVRGAGGNRTPVHQPVIELATTIPDFDTDAVPPTGRLSARGGPRSVFPVSHRSFPTSTVFPVVIPHFCCRAVMEWPRAALLLTMLRSGT